MHGHHGERELVALHRALMEKAAGAVIQPVFYPWNGPGLSCIYKKVLVLIKAPHTDGGCLTNGVNKETVPAEVRLQ